MENKKLAFDEAELNYILESVSMKRHNLESLNLFKDQNLRQRVINAHKELEKKILQFLEQSETHQ